MAENGGFLHGLEWNGGVMASQWYTTTNFHKLYPMVKTASLYLFWELSSLLIILYYLIIIIIIIIIAVTV